MNEKKEKEDEKMINNIKSKFKNGHYEIEGIPRILHIDNSGIRVRNNSTIQNIQLALENRKSWRNISYLNKKIKAFCPGEYDLRICTIDKKYFHSRETFDNLYSESWISENEPTENYGPIKTINCISIEKALFDIFGITISFNTQYYLSNRQELETDFGSYFRELDVEDIDETSMKTLEMKLLYGELSKIFGNNQMVDKDKETLQSRVNFERFKFWYSDGNYKHASAERGEKYYIFSFVIS